jgi:hypothetical protein
MAEIYHSLVAALSGSLPVPLESALKCLVWVAENPHFHRFMIANDSVDFMIEKLLVNVDAPESEYYLAALLSLAKLQEAAREQCGEKGVSLALHGFQNGSQTAAKLLAALLDFLPNQYLFHIA